jgi:hypothetical protein
MKITKQPPLVLVIIHKKQLDNVEYFKNDQIKCDARCTREIKSRIFIAKAAFNKQENLCISKLDQNLRRNLVNCYIRSIALCCAEN